MPKPNVSKARFAGRFTLVPVVLFLVICIASFWYATQWVASMLAYQAQLGQPWFHLGTARVYDPFEIFKWVYWYWPYAPHQFNEALKVCYLGPIAAVVAVVGYAVWLARRARVAGTFGTARWATKREVARSGLLGQEGVVLGVTDDGRYLMDNGEEHVISLAPTGSGKGVGQVIPTLLTWRHSVLVHDIKGENWALTAGWRAKFSNVIYFNPADPKSARFNPLFEVRPGLEQIKDVQNIADMIVDPHGKGKESHWDKTADQFFLAVILHVLHSKKDKTLAGVRDFLQDPSRTMTQTLAEMLATRHADEIARAEIASGARAMMNKSPLEASSIVSTALTFLGLYADPIVARVTSESDFQIRDLMDAERPLSLYIIVPPSDMSRTRPLIRLMLTMIGRRLTETLQVRRPDKPARGLRRILGRSKPAEVGGPTHRHRLLMLIDEFPQLGKLDFFQEQLAFVRGYGIKAFLIVQSKNQLDDKYGPRNSIIDHCRIRVLYTPNDEKTPEFISAMLGETTEVHQQTTYTGHRLSPWLGHVMVADQESGRPLLTRGEVSVFPETDSIIFVAGKYPIRAKKLRYFEDPFFTARVLDTPALRDARPYPYRPRPGVNPWARLATVDITGAVVEEESQDEGEGRERATPDEQALLDSLGAQAGQDTPADETQEQGLQPDQPQETDEQKRLRDEEQSRILALDDMEQAAQHHHHQGRDFSL